MAFRLSPRTSVHVPEQGTPRGPNTSPAGGRRGAEHWTEWELGACAGSATCAQSASPGGRAPLPPGYSESGRLARGFSNLL